jgi:hypothetical protein
MRRVAVVVILLAFPATARAERTVSLTFPARGADAGKRIPFRYATTGLPQHAVVKIQRDIHRGIYTLKKLKPRRHGRGQLPALEMGDYTLRITAFRRGSREALASDRASLHVYGDVSFSDVFNVPEQSHGDFQYVLADHVAPGAPHEAFAFTSTRCRSVHLDWELDSAAPGTIAVAGTGAAMTPGVTGALDAKLEPGAAWGVSETVEADADVYLNGSVSCTSPPHAPSPSG